MNDDKVFIDTNVFTYVFDDAEPKKQAAAKRCIEREQREREIIISTQVLQELYVSLTRGTDPIATPEIAARAVREVAGYTVMQVDTQLVLSGIEASQRNQISLWDALILRAAAQAGCARLLSEDLNAGQMIEGVRVENPLVSTAPR